MAKSQTKAVEEVEEDEGVSNVQEKADSLKTKADWQDQLRMSHEFMLRQVEALSRELNRAGHLTGSVDIRVKELKGQCKEMIAVATA